MMEDEKDKVPLAVKNAPKEGALLKNSWPLVNHGNCKIHFARWNGSIHPLDDWLKDKSRWQAWQQSPTQKNEFNRRYIFSLMQFYHEAKTWLFGGMYKVIGRTGDGGYNVEPIQFGEEYIGRLKIQSPYMARTARTNMKPYYNNFQVKEMLDEPYSGPKFIPFPGFDKVKLSFKTLKDLVDEDNPNWRNALESVKGVYLITDTKSGKRYVGSATGQAGVWGRWEEYMNKGHGGNVGIAEFIKNLGGLSYCQKNFHFTLLEHFSPTYSKQTILYREGYWMDMLHTIDTSFGLNKKSAKKAEGGYMKTGYSPSQRED